MLMTALKLSNLMISRIAAALLSIVIISNIAFASDDLQDCLNSHSGISADLCNRVIRKAYQLGDSADRDYNKAYDDVYEYCSKQGPPLNDYVFCASLAQSAKNKAMAKFNTYNETTPWRECQWSSADQYRPIQRLPFTITKDDACKKVEITANLQVLDGGRAAGIGYSAWAIPTPIATALGLLTDRLAPSEISALADKCPDYVRCIAHWKVTLLRSPATSEWAPGKPSIIGTLDGWDGQVIAR